MLSSSALAPQDSALLLALLEFTGLIRRIGREQIERYGNTDFIEGKITKVKKEAGDNYEFVVEEDADKGGRRWRGRTLVFATGCRDIFPDLAGYADNWGENIYQCLFCDGHERSHLPSGVLAYPVFNPMTIKLLTTAHFISLPPDRARVIPPSGKGSGTSPPKSKVTFFTNGPLSPSDEPSHASALEICAAYGITVDQRKVLKLVPDSKEGVHIHLANDICASKTPNPTSSIHLGWIAHKPPTEPSVPDLISQLELETSNSPFGSYLTATPPFNSTSMPGVFACGDTGVMMAHVTVAMSTGIACAAGVLDWCNQKDNQIALEIWRGRDRSNRCGIKIRQTLAKSDKA
ncbi:hypothetical protein [Phaffia rhodozyma]|uniref:FAD/NAD(P)-binding domain-containing protein n=1 Tax=Phaffia rhodozyma TaxID=264483 RepID=A0A0F7SP49_PHARH|nr:hypothetical protein [Phaffia rhodozyma]